jgi:hypothetical protein
MKMDADEKDLLDSVERGEWKSAKGGKRERARHSRYAKATFRKHRRLNIRLSSKIWRPSRSGRSSRVCNGERPPQLSGARRPLRPREVNRTGFRATPDCS